MRKSVDLTLACVLVAASTMAIATPGHAAITTFIVYHSQTYTQNASGLSAPDAGVQTTIVTSGIGDFDGGAVTAPDGSVATAINQSSGPLGQFGADFGPQPFGTFTVNLSNSATFAAGSASLSYLADHYPSVAPQVSNYAALQHFDPTKDNSIVLTSGFALPIDATDASKTFFIFDEATQDRLLQYSLDPGATVFDIPQNTAFLGEKVGYYFESDIDYDTTVDGVLDINVYRKITTGEINAATSAGVPEPAAWAMMLAGFAGIGAMSRLGGAVPSRARRRIRSDLSGPPRAPWPAPEDSTTEDAESAESADAFRFFPRPSANSAFQNAMSLRGRSGSGPGAPAPLQMPRASAWTRVASSAISPRSTRRVKPSGVPFFARSPPCQPAEAGG